MPSTPGPPPRLPRTLPRSRRRNNPQRPRRRQRPALLTGLPIRPVIEPCPLPTRTRFRATRRQGESLGLRPTNVDENGIEEVLAWQAPGMGEVQSTLDMLKPSGSMIRNTRFKPIFATSAFLAEGRKRVPRRSAKLTRPGLSFDSAKPQQGKALSSPPPAGRFFCVPSMIDSLKVKVLFTT